MGAEWRSIAVSKGAYEVSNLGQVRRVTAGRGTHPGKYVAPYAYRNGYAFVTLSGRNHKVHVLVAAAFIGPRHPSLDINHIDGNKRNNAASNLEYCTRSENAKHALRLGLRKMQTGESHPKAKLSDVQVAEIRSIWNAGTMTKTAIAEMFKSPPRTIAAICNGTRRLQLAGTKVVCP